MIVRSREYMPINDEPLPGKLLGGALKEWQSGLERLEKLRKAYENDRDILKRTRPAGRANNRMAHGFAKYIATMSSGYMVGKPVAYSAPEGQEQALEQITSDYRRSDMDSVDVELARYAAIYGKTAMIVYADEEAVPRCAAIGPENAFVVYDDSIERKPMFGVMCARKLTIDGEKAGWEICVETEDRIFEYSVDELDNISSAQPVSITEHKFGGVPIIEVWNDENEQGDFEQVQSLIDAYDVLESDRTNDTEQHVNALLVLVGASLIDDENGRTPAQQIKQDKILMLPNSDAKAEYLTATLSQADVEVLRSSIASDIHKFSMVPDLTDENFAGNSSGVAMKYKLLGLESLVKIKEPWFVEALRERLRLFANFEFVRGQRTLDVDEVTITLSRALPVNELEVAQMVSTLQGLVPDEILVGQVPFVDDPVTAMDKLMEQKTEAAKREAALYGLQQANDKTAIKDDGDDGNAEE